MGHLVDLNKFIAVMGDRWEGLGNVTNSALEAAWMQMAEVFNQHISGQRKNWSVLQLPTGTGKTQGLAVYCAELSKLEKQCGVVIVTRFTAEADELCRLINELSGSQQAIARHSKIESEDTEVSKTPVLIVTHKAYLDAVEEYNPIFEQFNITLDDTKQWDDIIRWKEGIRKLTIIDETLNAVEVTKVNLDEIRLLRGFISYQDEVSYPKQVSALNKIIETLQAEVKKHNNERRVIEYLEWNGILHDEEFWKFLWRVANGTQASRLGSSLAVNASGNIKSYLRKIIRRLGRIIKQWCMYHNVAGEHTFATGKTGY